MNLIIATCNRCGLREKQVETAQQKENYICISCKKGLENNMTFKNNTNMKIPKKYQHMLSEVDQDGDGYWAYSKDGFYFNYMDSHTAHEDTQKELLEVIRSLTPCNCEDCQEELGKA